MAAQSPPSARIGGPGRQWPRNRPLRRESGVCARVLGPTGSCWRAFPRSFPPGYAFGPRALLRGIAASCSLLRVAAGALPAGNQAAFAGGPRGAGRQLRRRDAPPGTKPACSPLNRAEHGGCATSACPEDWSKRALEIPIRRPRRRAGAPVGHGGDHRAGAAVHQRGDLAASAYQGPRAIAGARRFLCARATAPRPARGGAGRYAVHPLRGRCVRSGLRRHATARRARTGRSRGSHRRCCRC